MSNPIYVIMENISENNRNIVIITRSEFGYFLNYNAAAKVADELNRQWKFKWLDIACSHELDDEILEKLNKLAEKDDDELFIDALGWHLPDDTLYDLREELGRFAALPINPHNQDFPIRL